VELAGPRTHDDLPAEYAAAHIVVVPSITDATGDRDGLPNVVLEAMSSGRPVVASDVGAVSSAVVDGRTGVLVPPGDAEALAGALEFLADQADMRERLGREARARVEADFELHSCTARLRAFLETVYA
jgi:glycosyltransferase involved in cell wall biosynthesis